MGWEKRGRKMREQCVCCSLIWSKSSVSLSVRCWALLSSHNASRVCPVQCCPNDLVRSLPSSHLPFQCLLWFISRDLKPKISPSVHTLTCLLSWWLVIFQPQYLKSNQPSTFPAFTFSTVSRNHFLTSRFLTWFGFVFLEDHESGAKVKHVQI